MIPEGSCERSAGSRLPGRGVINTISVFDELDKEIRNDVR